MATTFGTPVFGADGVVATPHYLASLAAVNALRDGGSAVDAALAANFVLAVVWPHMCGPGGDLFAQVWSPRDNSLFALNASGRAGSAMNAQAYRDQGLNAMPQRGPLTVTVPGAVAGWFTLHARWGRLDMQRLVRDAVHAARDGFRTTPFTGAAIAANADLLRKHGGGADVFLPNGRLPAPGDRLVQADLAATFNTIAREGPHAFYAGEIAERIVDYLAARGGKLAGPDLSSQNAEWVDPIAVDYRGARVHQVPPNSQGIALLEILNMLSDVDLARLDVQERIHQLVERKKLALADRDAAVADPACADLPISQLIEPSYAARRACHVAARAAEHAPAALRPDDGDTVYLCAADRDGMVVSLIQSLYAAFGSGVHVPGTGITLHNRGFGFVLTPGHPNELAPRKRPMHTLMPGFGLRDGRPWLAFGTRGADGQPQTGLQIVTALLDLGLDLQAAIEAPRWVHSAPGDRFPRTALVLESRFAPDIAAQLEQRGHHVLLADPLDTIMGTVQLIQIDEARGCYIAASDPRGDGVALAI